MEQYIRKHPLQNKYEVNSTDPTHVLMTVEEFKRTRENDRAVRDRLTEIVRDKVSAESKAEAKWAPVVNELTQQVAALKARVAELEDINGQFASFGKHLLKINRERANAVRNIRPRKAGSGFIIRSMKESWVTANNHQKRCYITTIETPYILKMSLDDIDPEAISRDVFGEVFDVEFPEDRNSHIEDLAYKTDTPLWNNKENASYSEYNVIFKRNWQTGRNGYWELVCWHTKPFDNIYFGRVLPEFDDSYINTISAYADETHRILEEAGYFMEPEEDDESDEE